MTGGIVWTGIITGVITATATLLGVWLTQRHNVRMRLLDRHEDRRVEQRTVLADVLVNGREGRGSVETLGRAAVKMDPVALAQTDTLATFTDRSTAHGRALVNARLVTRDPITRAHVGLMSEAAATLPPYVARIHRATSGGTRSPVELMDEMAVGARAYRTALNNLERLIRERVVDDPVEARRRWWQRVGPPR